MVVYGRLVAEKMATRTSTKWQPPKGISFRDDEARKKPYGVFWREDSKRKAKFFPSETARKKFAQALAREKKKKDSDFTTLTSKEVDEWRRFREKTRNAPLDAIADCWLHYGFGLGGAIIEDIVPRFLEEKIAKGISADMQSGYRVGLRRFVDRFGKQRMDTVSPEDLFQWLQSLDFAPVTKANHRKRVRAFYSWANARGHCRSNPAKLVEDQVESKDVTIMTVEDGRKLFDTNRDFPAIGRLALEAFGCLRYSSAKRLTEEDVNWEERGITLPASKLKTGRRTYVDGHPNTLWEWLEHASPECWNLSERQYQEEKVWCFKRAGVPHPQNVLRHSACSYHYAAFKNPGLTAVLMSHTNLRTMEQFYRGRATQKQGEAWFSIRP